MTSPPICVVLFLVTYHYLSVHFCDSVQSVSCNCCLDELRFAANKVQTSHFYWQSAGSVTLGVLVRDRLE